MMLSQSFYRFLSWGILVCLVSSCYRPLSREYQEFYHHLREPLPVSQDMRETDYFLIILVDARHLDYTNTFGLLKTVAKHPDDGSKTRDVGHAWIYLKGKLEGKDVVVEGGHSGERGVIQARYFDGIMNYYDWGYANPTEQQKRSPRYEPNPVKYLWASLDDGFFQKGSGRHVPTFAAKVDLTEAEFKQILSFIHPRAYPYRKYALVGHQCSSFVAQVAGLANFYFDYQLSMPIEQDVWYGRTKIRLWEDPYYSCLTFSSPDIIEKGLKEAVREGRAEDALDWYQHHR